MTIKKSKVGEIKRRRHPRKRDQGPEAQLRMGKALESRGSFKLAILAYQKASSGGSQEAKERLSLLLRKREGAEKSASLPSPVQPWEDVPKAGMKQEVQKIPQLSLKDAVLPSASATPEAFLATAAMFFRSEHSQADLSREVLASHLQKYIDSVQGQFFDPDTSKAWCQYLDAYLTSTGLAVECLGKDCDGVPATPKYGFTLGGRKGGGQFRTEHLDSPKQIRHGGPTVIPQYTVIYRPFPNLD